MRAMAIHRFGGPEEIVPVDLDDPTPGPGEVVIAIDHAGVNPVDHKMRDGSSKFVADFTPDDFPFVLGREACGRVIAIGPDVDLHLDQRVFGMVDGAYATRAAVPAANISPVSPDADPQVLAGTALAGLTAWNAVHDLAKVRPDDRVLVHGGGGGVGQIIVQLAAATGATVWATASERHHEKLNRWGAIPIDYASQDFRQVVDAPTVVIDCVYHGTYEPSIGLLQPGDRMVVLPTLADLGPAREAELQVAIPTCIPDRDRLERLGAMVADGTLEVVVGRVFELDEAPEAHRLVETGHANGKVVLRVPQD